MRRIGVSEARADWSNLVNSVAYAGERVVINRRNKDLAAVVPIEDLELLQHLEDLADVAAVRKALREPGSIPLEKILKELGLSDVRNRAETRGSAGPEASS